MLDGVAHEDSRLSEQERNWRERQRERERTEDRRETVNGRVGGEQEEGNVSTNDRRVILTVGHTLILDLQVLVGPWAGVREDI